MTKKKMKQINIKVFQSILLCMVCISAKAQLTTMTIDNQTPGWLSSKINYGDQQTIENLKVTGYINNEDLKFISTLATRYSLHGRLDLEDVNIVGDTPDQDNYLINSSDIFGGESSDTIKLHYFSYPKTLKGSIDSRGKYNNGGLNRLNTDTLFINTTSGFTMALGAKIKHLVIGDNITVLEYPSFSDAKGIFETVSFPSTLKEFREKYNTYSRSLISIGIQNGKNLKEFPSLERLLAKINVNEMPDSVYLPQIKVLSLNQYYKYHSDAMFKAGMHIFIGEKIDTITEMLHAEGINLHFSSPTPPVMEGSYTYHQTLGNRSWFKLFVPKGSANAYRACFENGGTNVTIIEEDVSVKSLTLDKHVFSLKVGESEILKVDILPDNASNKTINWSSDNTDVAVVNYNGRITAKKAGKAIITAASVSNPEVKDVCEVTVIQPVLGINIVEPSIKLVQMKETKQLTAIINPDDATDKTVIWSSMDENIATVNENGIVSAKLKGNTTIVATSASNPEITDICEVIVIKPVESITLDKTSILFTSPGESTHIQATVLPEDASDKNVRWYSSNSSVCTISEKGMVVAVGAGSSVITATTIDGGFVATCMVTVLQPVTSVKLNKHTLSIRVGTYEELGVTISPDDASDKSVIWSSSDSSVAEVSESGVVTARKAGNSTISVVSVSNSEVKDICSVNVLQPVNSVSISDAMFSFDGIGGVKQLTATVLPQDASDKSVRWDSSNESVCTVSKSGIVVAVGVGTSVVTVTTVDGGFVAVCIVTVKETDGIVSIDIDSLNGNERIYDAQGKRIANLQRGINIIRMNDGSIRKVVVK